MEHFISSNAFCCLKMNFKKFPISWYVGAFEYLSTFIFYFGILDYTITTQLAKFLFINAQVRITLPLTIYVSFLCPLSL